MNRPPGPSDSWYKRHQEECGGTWEKIAEPEKKDGKSQKNKLDKWINRIKENGYSKVGDGATVGIMETGETDNGPSSSISGSKKRPLFDTSETGTSTIVESDAVARVGDGEIDSPGSRKKVIVECYLYICGSGKRHQLSFRQRVF